MTATTEVLKLILEAFNQHNVSAIMEFFSADCILQMPRGPDPYGKQYVGKEQVGEAFANRFQSIPDVHYSEDKHWVAGERGVSEWLLTGTTTGGTTLRLYGCDLWEFRNGKVIRKDSYWKIVEP